MWGGTHKITCDEIKWRNSGNKIENHWDTMLTIDVIDAQCTPDLWNVWKILIIKSMIIK